MSEHACLQAYFIPPALAELFASRRLVQSASRRAAAADGEWDERARSLLAGDTSDEGRKDARLFEALSRQLPGERDPVPLAARYRPSRAEVLFRAHVSWLYYDGKAGRAKAALLARARELRVVPGAATYRGTSSKGGTCPKGHVKNHGGGGGGGGGGVREQGMAVSWRRGLQRRAAGGVSARQRLGFGDKTSIKAKTARRAKVPAERGCAAKSETMNDGDDGHAEDDSENDSDNDMEADVEEYEDDDADQDDAIASDRSEYAHPGSAKRKRRPAMKQNDDVSVSHKRPKLGHKGTAMTKARTIPMAHGDEAAFDAGLTKSARAMAARHTTSERFLHMLRIDPQHGILVDHPCEVGKTPVTVPKQHSRGVDVHSHSQAVIRTARVANIARPTVARLPANRHPGGTISSTLACRVLRIVAELPPPRPTPSTGPRKKPSRRPPVWAESRQELCETLAYYRAFQAGLYMSGRVAYGYLLDAYPAPRDTWAKEGRIVISHGGGQCIQVDGQAVLAADQSPSDVRVDALLAAARNRTPIILIAGAGYALLPWSLGCAYAVLGWYWISATWVEAEPIAMALPSPRGKSKTWFNRYKIRFDWVQGQGEPWWLHEGGNGLAQGGAVQNHMPSSDETNPHVPEGAEGPKAQTVRDHTLSSGEISHDCPEAEPQQGRAETSGETIAIATSGAGDDEGEDEMLLGGKGSHGQGAMSLQRILNLDPNTGLLTPPITPPDQTKKKILEEEFRKVSTTDDPAPLVHASSCFDTATCRFDSDMDGHSDERSPVTGGTTAPRAAEDEPDTRSRVGRPGSNHLRQPSRLIACSLDHVPPFTHLERVCIHCAHPSPRLYAEGWTCLHPDCPAFWLLDTKVGSMPIPPGFSLQYQTDWLETVETPLDVVMPYGIVPPVPGGSGAVGDRSLWKGWVCDQCGRANCRYRWEVWECRHCGNQLSPLRSTTPCSAASVRDEVPPILGNGIILPSSGITAHMSMLEVPGAQVVQYKLPQAGTVYHIMPRDLAFADELFEAYQVEAADTPAPLFQRRALKSNTVKGQLLAQHFAVNSGARYKYIVDTLSLPFSESPACVLRALTAISQGARSVIGEDVGFNEVLSVLYREGQKMSWHDDGEDGLGPVVGSLSLGSSATMSFRRKPGRQEPNIKFRQGPHAKRIANPLTALSITLSHGDMVVMSGREIQKLWSHRVVPLGFRVAATARMITRGIDEGRIATAATAV